MKYNEFIKQVVGAFKETDYYECLNTTYAILRFGGLLYDKYLYKKEYKDFKKVYESEQVIAAVHLAFDFITQADQSKFNNEQHKINFVINCVQRNLKMLNNSTDALEEELNNVLDMEIWIGKYRLYYFVE